MTQDIVEKLRCLHVWPQSVADEYAGILTPRQIAKLYEVGGVSHQSADIIEQLRAENERLREVLRFYANPKAYVYNKSAGIVEIEADGGEIAMTALAAQQKEVG